MPIKNTSDNPSRDSLLGDASISLEYMDLANSSRSTDTIKKRKRTMKSQPEKLLVSSMYKATRGPRIAPNCSRAPWIPKVLSLPPSASILGNSSEVF